MAATAATAALSTGGLALHIGSWYSRTPREGLHALSPEEYDFIQAIAEAWAPPGGVPAISGAEAQMGTFFDGVVSSMAPQQGKLLRMLLHVLDEETVPGHFARFQHLPLDTRIEVLRGWLDSPWFLQRQAVGAVMALLSFGYTEHPEVAATLQEKFRCGFGP